MAPPSYSDLGKACRDLFMKGYNFGQIKLDCKTPNCIEDVLAGGSHDVAEQKTSGYLGTKLVAPQYGLTFAKNWKTDNTLSWDVSCDDKIYPGVKVGVLGDFNFDTG